MPFPDGYIEIAGNDQYVRGKFVFHGDPINCSDSTTDDFVPARPTVTLEGAPSDVWREVFRARKQSGERMQRYCLQDVVLSALPAREHGPAQFSRVPLMKAIARWAVSAFRALRQPDADQLLQRLQAVEERLAALEKESLQTPPTYGCSQSGRRRRT